MEHFSGKLSFVNRVRLFVLYAAGACTLFSSEVIAQATYYVSPAGNNNNPGTIAQPFATIEKARDVVRTINSAMTGDITIFLRCGTYSLDSTIKLDKRDGGTNGHRVIYKAYPGEMPVISGGVAVTGWTQHNGNIYKAPLNRLNKLRALYVNGQRAYMANKTVKPTGWGTNSGVCYSTSDLPQVTTNADDIELTCLNTWTTNIVCVNRVTTNGTCRNAETQEPFATIARAASYNMGFMTNYGNATTFYDHMISNVFDFLTASGQFFFDKSTKTVYYYKRNGEDMATATAYAPNNVSTFLQISGTDNNNRVQNITISGIVFLYSDWNLWNVQGSYGQASLQGTNGRLSGSNWGTAYRNHDIPPAVIAVDNAVSIVLERNTIQHAGCNGINMLNDVWNSKITGNRISDLGGTGICLSHLQHQAIGDDGTTGRYPPGVEGMVFNIEVSNNYILDAARMFWGFNGVQAYWIDSLNFHHNQIENTPYSGLSCGWGWGGADVATLRNVKINYNRIFKTMQTLEDGGAIYTLRGQPNSEMIGNYIKDIGKPGGRRVFHTDEGTAWFNITNNVAEIGNGMTIIEANDYGRKHDIHCDSTYSTSNSYNYGCPNCTVTNVFYCPNGWPAKAQAIISNAGLEPAYQDLLAPLSLGSCAIQNSHLQKIHSNNKQFEIHQTAHQTVVSFVNQNETHELNVINAMGKLVFSASGTGLAEYSLTSTIIGRGFYFIAIATEGKTIAKKMFLF